MLLVRTLQDFVQKIKFITTFKVTNNTFLTKRTRVFPDFALTVRSLIFLNSPWSRKANWKKTAHFKILVPSTLSEGRRGQVLQSFEVRGVKFGVRGGGGLVIRELENVLSRLRAFYKVTNSPDCFEHFRSVFIWKASFNTLKLLNLSKKTVK